MSRKFYSLPASDIQVEVEYEIRRDGYVRLVDCYIGDVVFDASKLFLRISNPGRFENFQSLETYFQLKLDEDQAFHLIDEAAE